MSVSQPRFVPMAVVRAFAACGKPRPAAQPRDNGRPKSDSHPARARRDNGGPNPLIDRIFDDRAIFIGSGSRSLGSLFNR